MTIRVVDLFAGPGGLSEGFDRYRKNGKRIFRSVLSVEDDEFAHRTLLLRAFFRQFNRAPTDYYAYLKGELPVKELYARHPSQYAAAKAEAIRLTLAPRNKRRIDSLVRKALGSNTRPWVLIGGPPCQAYSVVGRARRSKEDRKSFERDGRHFLYREYLRILEKFKPPVFVMENVKGLLSSSVNGVEIFQKMLQDFVAAGYNLHSFTATGNGLDLNPRDYVIEAEQHGIPQTRHRVILLGIRQGLERGSWRLRDAIKQVPIEAAIGDLPRIRSRISPPSRDSSEAWEREVRRLRSVFNSDRRLAGLPSPRSTLGDLNGGSTFIERRYRKPAKGSWLNKHRDWFLDRRIGGVTLHDARRHMPKDLRRYLFASHYACVHGVSPDLVDFPVRLRPAHRNVGRAVREDLFGDRFRVQIKGKPATTVVSHLRKDGHYFIHYDPTQCRSLTVREAARLQTFPDNYFFEGPRTAQYQQVGNAVPPLLAKQLAAVVCKIVEQL